LGGGGVVFWVFLKTPWVGRVGGGGWGVFVGGEGFLGGLGVGWGQNRKIGWWLSVLRVGFVCFWRGVVFGVFFWVVVNAFVSFGWGGWGGGGFLVGETPQPPGGGWGGEVGGGLVCGGGRVVGGGGRGRGGERGWGGRPPGGGVSCGGGGFEGWVGVGGGEGGGGWGGGGGGCVLGCPGVVRGFLSVVPGKPAPVWFGVPPFVSCTRPALSLTPPPSREKTPRSLLVQYT